MRLQFIQYANFPPFDDGRIEFPEKTDDSLAEVHLLTGQNGCGKTRLLCALAAACGNSADLDQRHTSSEGHGILVGLQKGKSESAFVRPWNSIWDSISGLDDYDTLVDKNLQGLNQDSPGVIRFPDGSETLAQENGWRQLAPTASDWQPEHKFAAQCYRGTARVSDHAIKAMEPIPAGDPIRHLSFDRQANDDAIICQSMANLKLSSAMELQSEAPINERRFTQIIQRFEDAVTEVTGRKFSFVVSQHPDLHLVVKWGQDKMKLATLPDGLRSIIGWLIACVAKLEAQFPEEPNPLDVPLILLLDEPESHLHPAWQRQLLPAAQRLFPNAQIFAATHSPFVISSVNSGWIHILRPNAEGIVNADPPIPCSQGDSFLDAIEDVLGITQWYDPETERLLSEFRSLKATVNLNPDRIEELKALAEIIANRSDSLKAMMARELHQIQQQFAEGAAAK